MHRAPSAVLSRVVPNSRSPAQSPPKESCPRVPATGLGMPPRLLCHGAVGMPPRLPIATWAPCTWSVAPPRPQLSAIYSRESCPLPPLSRSHCATSPLTTRMSSSLTAANLKWALLPYSLRSRKTDLPASCLPRRCKFKARDISFSGPVPTQING